jgi:hypothetical protein
MDGMAYLRTLLDPERLAVVGAVALTPRSAADVAARTGVEARTVLTVLGPLVAAGLVARIPGDPDRYHLDATALRSLAHDLPQPPPPAREVMYGMTEAEQAVLGRFFTGRRLTEIPSQRSKRRVVLERLALEFEPGRHYPEAQVNEILRVYHDDVASLRRHLVDEGLLDRAEGRYWRSGGRVEP